MRGYSAPLTSIFHGNLFLDQTHPIIFDFYDLSKVKSEPDKGGKAPAVEQWWGVKEIRLNF